MENMLLSAKHQGEIEEVVIKEMEAYKRVRDQKLAETRGSFEQDINILEKENEKLRDKIKGLEEKQSKDKGIQEEISILNKKFMDLKNENLSLRKKNNKMSRPVKTSEVAKWVKESFPGRLVFHEKALALIEATQTSEVDMNLLCDAIEFLGKEYRSTDWKNKRRRKKCHLF